MGLSEIKNPTETLGIITKRNLQNNELERQLGLPLNTIDEVLSAGEIGQLTSILDTIKATRYSIFGSYGITPFHLHLSKFVRDNATNIINYLISLGYDRSEIRDTSIGNKINLYMSKGDSFVSTLFCDERVVVVKEKYTQRDIDICELEKNLNLPYGTIEEFMSEEDIKYLINVLDKIELSKVRVYAEYGISQEMIESCDYIRDNATNIINLYRSRGYTKEKIKEIGLFDLIVDYRGYTQSIEDITDFKTNFNTTDEDDVDDDAWVRFVNAPSIDEDIEDYDDFNDSMSDDAIEAIKFYDGYDDDDDFYDEEDDSDTHTQDELDEMFNDVDDNRTIFDSIEKENEESFSDDEDDFVDFDAEVENEVIEDDFSDDEDFHDEGLKQ